MPDNRTKLEGNLTRAAICALCIAVPAQATAQVRLPDHPHAQDAGRAHAMEEECSGSAMIVGVALGLVIGAVAGYHIERYVSGSGGENPGLAGLLLGGMLGGVGGGVLGSRACATPGQSSRGHVPGPRGSIWHDVLQVQAAATRKLPSRVPDAARYLLLRGDSEVRGTRVR